MTILNLFNAKKDKMSTRDLSDHLANSLEHSSESIRDRIKRYISKLSTLDSELLKEEAQVSIPTPFYKYNFKRTLSLFEFTHGIYQLIFVGSPSRNIP